MDDERVLDDKIFLELGETCKKGGQIKTNGSTEQPLQANVLPTLVGIYLETRRVVCEGRPRRCQEEALSFLLPEEVNCRGNPNAPFSPNKQINK